jgi:uncharacterized protein YfaS (alpha-2-macroglobulin family)
MGRMRFLLEARIRLDAPVRLDAMAGTPLLMVLAILAGLLTLPASHAPAHAQERSVELFENTDFFGGDLRTVKKVGLEACQRACLNDSACQAFTYNVKARWCFLKSELGTRKSFDGAVSGLIRTASTAGSGSVPRNAGPDIGAAPNLDFIDRFLSRNARDHARALKRAARNQNPRAADGLIATGRSALDSGNPGQAVAPLAAAAGLLPERSDVWSDLSAASLRASSAGNAIDYDLRRDAVHAGLLAYRTSRNSADRARALSVLGDSLAADNRDRPALEAYKQSLAIDDDPAVRRVFADLRARSGFRIVNHRIDSDSTNPRACIEFSEAIDPTVEDYRPYLRLGGQSPGEVTAESQQICVDGLAHGQRYRITVNEGLPSSVNEPLLARVDLDLYVRDRSASARFSGDRYVLPVGTRQAIPIVSVNAPAIELNLYRLPERAVAEQLRSGDFASQLYGYRAEQMGTDFGDEIWSGVLDVEVDLNREVITAMPLDDIEGGLTEPGLYVLTARPQDADAESWGPRATQWMIVSDIGLSGIEGTHGMTVMARSLDSAAPLQGLSLDLIARNNSVLGTMTTDANGFAEFPAGLLRGNGGAEPTALVARDTNGGFVFLDLGRAGFDFSDRGVEGHTAPGPVDVFAWTERGIYRPGETIHISALARNATDVHSVDLPLTFIVTRPDGVEDGRHVSASPVSGGHVVDVVLPDNAMQGTWRIATHGDTDAAPLAESLVLVEDFVPERMALDLSAPDTPVSSDGRMMLRAEGRFLYGAPAAGLALEGTIAAVPTRSWDAAENYFFGLAEEEGTGRSVADLTDLDLLSDDGTAAISAELPPLPATTRLLRAEAIVRLREPGGRAVEDKLSRIIAPRGVMIGIDPQFADDAVDENSEARFRIAAFDPDGTVTAAEPQPWRLERIERRYQWYRSDGNWRYEPADFTTLVAAGTMALDGAAPAELVLPVEWGRYRLSVGGAGVTDPVASIQFDAGWFVSASATDTPDGLEIALDRDSYVPGDVARLRVSPRFAGELILTIGSDRVLDTRSLTLSQSVVNAGGTEFEIPVSADWGAGAYVTATLIRPGSAQDNRMPMRAIGVTWLAVDPGSRALAVSLEAPAQSRPNGALRVPVSVPGAAGVETYVTLAAVDAGILSLTGYEPPEPSGWYFGQRRLGLEYRDLYGRLIDGSQGALGRLRTGGDGGPQLNADGARPDGPLVAFFSGPVLLDANGNAEISFDMPSFNGTVRLMAVAWNDQALGQGMQDVIVRDPVVITASLPRFLAPGDATPLRLDIANTDGPAGDYTLRIAPGSGMLPLVDIAQMPAAITLEAGGKAALSVPLEAVHVGVGALGIELTHPSGLTISQDVPLDVRPGAMPVTRRYELDLAANGGALTLGQDLLDEVQLAGASVTLDAARTRGLDTAALLMQLDRYPLGCVEQMASRALPLLYLSELQGRAGLAQDTGIATRIDAAIRRVLSHQNGSGGFGLWRANGASDLWLDSYIADFLTRARAEGHAVPETAMTVALDNLRNRIAYTQADERAEAGLAYALYVLARNRRVSIGDLRFYADAKINAFASPMERAQIAASLALYGDTARATALFENALAVADNTAPPDARNRRDYGTPLRDGAALLALAGESRPAPSILPRIADHVADAYRDAGSLSTQEQLWLVLAARALQTDGEADGDALRFIVAGQAHSGILSRRFEGADLIGTPVRVVNQSADSVAATVTVNGAPRTPPARESNGLTIDRAVYDLSGNPIDLSAMRQNARAVVVLTVGQDEPAFARLAITDLLPAGLEIDNPRIVDSARLEAFDWLPDTLPVHAEFRADRFVAAFDRTAAQDELISVAYVVRAVRPGTFTAPGAHVEDMYRPTRNARSASGELMVRTVQ